MELIVVTFARHVCMYVLTTVNAIAHRFVCGRFDHRRHPESNTNINAPDLFQSHHTLSLPSPHLGDASITLYSSFQLGASRYVSDQSKTTPPSSLMRSSAIIILSLIAPDLVLAVSHREWDYGDRDGRVNDEIKAGGAF